MALHHRPAGRDWRLLILGGEGVAADLNLKASRTCAGSLSESASPSCRRRYGSLSQVAKAMTGTSWNGHRFFGLRTAGSDRSAMVPRWSGDCDAASQDAASTPIKDGGAAFARRSSRQAASP